VALPEGSARSAPGCAQPSLRASVVILMKKKIMKRFLTVGRTGNVLGGNTENLVDDGRGRISFTARRLAGRCPSCRRPITDVAQQVGRCDYCRRGFCDHCATRCQVCARRLCGDCRRGFVGRTWMTVCPICLVRLRQRQAFQDQLLMRKVAFERQMLRQRELTRLQALNLQAAKARVMAQLQAARLRMTGQMAMIREMNRLNMALAKARRYGQRYLP